MASLRFVPSFSFRLHAVLLSTLVSTCAVAAPPSVVRADSPQPAAAIKQASERALPLVFEQNEGQLPAGTAFAGRTQAYTVEVRASELRFSMRGKQSSQTIDMVFAGAQKGQPAGISEAGFRTNYYVGADPRTWRTGIHNYDRIALRSLYPGVDAEFYSHSGEIEHDFVVAPGADTSRLAMHLSGAQGMSLTAAGDLELRAEEGYLRLHKPNAYQVLANGDRKTVDASFSLKASGKDGDLRFTLGAYDHSRQLVIDPIITYSTYVSGLDGSTASTIASDAAGNMYLSGTTTLANLTPGNTSPDCGTPPCGTNVFVFKLPAGSNGVSSGWVSYFGVSSTESIALTSSIVSGTTVYLAGYTNALTLASGTGTTVSNPTGGYVGFLSGLATSDGTLKGANLIYDDAANPNNVSVEGLAADAAGDIFLTGALGTTTIDPGSQNLTPSANAFAVVPAVTTFTNTPVAQPGNAYVAEYLAATPFSAAPAFFTYIQTNTLAKAIAVDAANLIYVAGQTTGGFNAPAPLAETNGSTGNDVFELNFSLNAETPAVSPTVHSFTWIDANAGTTVSSLAIDGLGNSYLFGNTLASNFAAALGTPACALQCTRPDAAGSGYAIEAAFNGTVTAYTYLGGSGATDTVVAGTFASGAAYVTGETDAPATAGATAVPFAATPTTQTGAAPFNTQALPLGEDQTVSGTKHGYVLSLAPTLATANYVANIGGAGPDTTAAIAVDGSKNAYVAANIVTASTPYTPYGAYEATTPATTGGSAYVAEISAAATPYGLTVTSATPTPDPLGYAAGPPVQSSSVTYTFAVNATASTPATNVVVNIPAVTGLTYNTATVTDATPGATGTPGTCSVGATGVSCVIASFPQTVAGTNDTLNVVLTATTNGSLVFTPPTLSVTATAASPASETASATDTSNLAPPSNVQITLGAPSATTVDAASANYASYTGTTVTYPIVLTNVGATAGEAKASVLSFTGPFPTGFTVTGVTAVAAGGGTIAAGSCDLTTAATGCTVDLPANASLTYSITGYYNDASIFTTASATPSVNSGTLAVGSFSAAATGSFNSTTATLPTNTTIQRAVDISTAAGSSAGTFDGLHPSAPKTTFNLSTTPVPAPVNYVYSITNAGPSIAYNVPLTAAYPVVPGTNSFVPGLTAGSGVVSCTTTGSLICTISQILPGGSATVTFTATYPDLAPAPDAVSAPAKSNIYNLSATATAPAFYQPYGTGSLSASFTSPVTIQRTAVLTTTVSQVAAVAPAATCAGANPCVYMFNPSATLNPNANQYDGATYTVTVSNAGPNASTATGITIPLPAAPVTGATPHVLMTAGATATPSATPAGWAGDTITSCTLAANQLSCGAPTVTSAIGIPANTNVAVNFTGTFDNGTVPLTALSVNTAAMPGSASVTADVVNALPLPTSLQTYTVERDAHLIVRKTRNTTVAVAPATYVDTTDPNLDEKTTATNFGKNDEIEYAVAIGNGGANDAPSVQFTDTLPPYFTVLRGFLLASTSALPDSGANATPLAASVGAPVCYAGATAAGTPIVLPYATGAGYTKITCTLPAGYLVVADTSTAAAFGPSGLEFVYQGKFQDNAPNADDILAGVNKYSVTSSVGDAAASTTLAVDYQPAADHMSQALGAYNIQRAAHLFVSATPVALSAPATLSPTGADQLLTMDPITGRFQVGEAEPATSGVGTVFNCLRYKVYVQNLGPNISRTPTVSISGGQFNVNSTAANTAVYSAAQTDTSLGSSCPGDAYGATTSATVTPGTASVAPSATVVLSPTSEIPNNSLVVDFDGYFALNTLTFALDGATPCFANCGARASSLATPTDPGTTESVSGPTSTTPTPTITVVNTPFGSGFNVAPFTPAGTQPTLLSFTTVALPGVTSETISSTAPPLPMGKSPYPPDNGVTRALYEPGRTPSFYTVPTTASVPSTGTNPTTVCFVNPAGGPLADVFVKPERALLWVLQNAPANTQYRSFASTFPTFTTTGNLAGDITTSVAPLSSANAYVQFASQSFPQAPQAQPAMVCGQVNGFSTASASTFGVLEPTNFPPYVVAGSTGLSGQAGKGSTQALSQLYIVKNGKLATYDFNDSDPCYIGGSRLTCDDNPYLNVFVFGGGNTGTTPEITGPQPLSGLTPDASVANAFDLAQINFTSQATGAVVVTDQATGADSFNDKITNISPLAFGHEGAFLLGDSTLNYPVCDPGLSSAGYSLSAAPCPGKSAPTTAVPSERYVAGGAPYILGNVGVSSVVGAISTGGGLIALPFPDSSTAPTTAFPINPGSTASGANPMTGGAIANVTPGQTAGFVWNWLNGVVNQGTFKYTLGCALYTSATSTTPIALPAGMSCNITTNNPASPSPNIFMYSAANYAPTIFVVTSGNQFAQQKTPTWLRLTDGIALAMLLPLFLARRRFRKGAIALLLLLSLAVGPMLIGCGSGGGFTTPANVTATGNYYFRVTATPTADSPAGGSTITSAPFEVIVQNAN